MTGARRRRRARRAARRRLLDDDVRVRAAEAERADAGDARGRRSRGHGVRVGRHARPAARPTAMCGLGVVKCRCAGISSCCSDKHDLDQPGDARRRLEVTDVRLHRADAERLARRRLCPNTAPSACDLDRIAQRRAGAVRFDVARPAVGATPARAQRLANHRLLRRAVRRRQPAARPSWFTAVPRITARMRSPSRCGVARGA